MCKGYGDLDFGMSPTIDSESVIRCVIPEQEPPYFTIVTPLVGFQLYFDTEALKEFEALATQILHKMEKSAPRIDDGAVIAGAVVGNAEVTNAWQLPWICVNRGCRIDYVISGEDVMFFRLGTASNRFEPEFHAEALWNLVRLARHALGKVEGREYAHP